MGPAPRSARVARLQAALTALLLICGHAIASDSEGYQDSERYQYILESGANASVCTHMKSVYKNKFRTPWKRPLLTKLVGDPKYSEVSPYAFPKLPGVTHDTMATFTMSYSRLPTSAEFEAVDWREGRIQYGGPVGEGPALVAELDIDNDGKKDFVVKGCFMRTPAVIQDGGADCLYIFRGKTLDLPNPIPQEMLGPRGSASGPAVIAALPEVPYRLIRPFRFQGTTYLAGYRQGDGRGRSSDHIDIVKYLGGGFYLGPGNRSPVQLVRVCKIQMRVVDSRK